VHLWLLAGTAFLASAVEAVEAFTIVLAVGVSRSWRVASGGALAALALLAVIAIVVGPLVGSRIPLGIVRIIAGAVALWLGYVWLRKAILRWAGRKALHDEAGIFERERNALARESVGGFATAFGGVFVEGIEVILIVVSLGTAIAGGLAAASAGAAAAVVFVALLGAAARGPLSRVPENLMKTAVAVMLLSFGTFWCGESLGVRWPLDDLVVPVLALFYTALSALAAGLLKRSGPSPA
jgi:uncharacterized membrane protein